MSRTYTALPGLMTLMTGDEKHGPSATSTLDVLWVLYDQVLRVSPDTIDDPGRDRFLLSKGHGPAAYYAVLAAKGFFPESWRVVRPILPRHDTPTRGDPAPPRPPGRSSPAGGFPGRCARVPARADCAGPRGRRRPTLGPPPAGIAPPGQFHDREPFWAPVPNYT